VVITWDQGTILDRIDYNMEAVVKHTKAGVSSSWKKAEKSQKNARPMCCIIIDGSKQY
jgi:syntaxin 16